MALWLTMKVNFGPLCFVVCLSEFAWPQSCILLDFYMISYRILSS